MMDLEVPGILWAQLDVSLSLQAHCLCAVSAVAPVPTTSFLRAAPAPEAGTARWSHPRGVKVTKQN